jgi:uncharacterized protein
MHFLLIYTLSPDYLERRGEFRAEHLTLGWASHARGALMLGGALSDPVDTAVLLFSAESKETVEEFARTDPYVTNGLVKSWQVRPWTTVIGSMAATPVHPPTSAA